MKTTSEQKASSSSKPKTDSHSEQRTNSSSEQRVHTSSEQRADYGRESRPAAQRRQKNDSTQEKYSARKGSAPELGTAIREHFEASTDLPSFLAGAGQLTVEQRKLIVRQALILLEENYVHLPLKRAMHSINPVQRLKLLLQLLDLPQASTQSSEMDFHGELIDIFASLRDLHTNYLLPAPFNQMRAFLPFMVEAYYEKGQRKYIVSNLLPNFQHPTFVRGVEVSHWNGTPIDKQIWNNAQRYAGSNRDARHARGVQTLTMRALRMARPPDEDWVVVSYLTLAGDSAELRFDWQVSPLLASAALPAIDSAPAAAASLGIDLEQDLIGRLRTILFAPKVVLASEQALEKSARGDAFSDLESKLPNIFTARVVTTPTRTFGHLRIWSFSHWPPEEFVDEFIRLMAGLPQDGLVIDVRGNGGGVIMNGELILQTLTSRTIAPEPLQFINTPLNLEICRRHDQHSGWSNLSAWKESMEQALQTNAVYSAGFPISDTEQCNAIGQKYFGPVVLITDALCYSTTDIFAAGFQDHDIGIILGTDGNTGAGGANVWEHEYLVRNVMPGSVYQSLPNGAGMRVAMRRTLRVGGHAGAPLEELGVVPNERYFFSKNDLLNKNEDLLNRAGALLATLPSRAFNVGIQSNSATQIQIEVSARGFTRIDLYLDDRPSQSIELTAATTVYKVPKFGPHKQVLEIKGFDGAQLVARYRANI